MDGVKVRDWLNKQGYNGKVGWDKNSQSVTLNGQQFYKPTNVQNGVSYGNQSDLSNALNKFKSGQRQEETQNNIYDLVNKLKERVNTQFQYNPNNDPAYQSALSQANRNIQQGNRQAMETMNTRGILNSTVTGDRLGQIAQQEYGRVSDTILPQLMQQAYNRNQDQTANLAGLISTLQNQYQTTADNQYRNKVFNANQDQQQFQNNITMGQLTGQINGQPTTAEQQRLLQNAWSQADALGYVTPALSQLTGIPQGTQTLQAKQIAISQQNADTSRMNAENKQNQSIDIKSEVSGLNQAIKTGQLTPAQALQQINDDEQLGLYTPEQASYLREQLQTIAGQIPQPKAQANPDTGMTTTANGQQVQIPSDQELNKMYYTDPTGKAAGRALFDWIAWNKSPEGRYAGVSFEDWDKLYGPKLVQG